jgi:hypothetical protein
MKLKQLNQLKQKRNNRLKVKHLKHLNKNHLELKHLKLTKESKQFNYNF